MKAKGKTAKHRMYDADALMIKLTSELVSDFQANLNDASFCSNFRSEAVTGSVASARGLVPVPTDDMDVYTYKNTYQIASLWKRYRFSNDTYSDQELIDKAVSGYLETQDRLAGLDLDAVSEKTAVILDLAARYISRILGEYDDEECRSLCRFGSGASVGVTARKASEAERWAIPISGSQQQIEWFESEMAQIPPVQEYLDRQKGSDLERSTYQPTSCLTLSLVPKTFKAFRSIMPNTTIGSYMTDGIGRIIRDRLKRVGYNIATLQTRHKLLALQSSVSGKNATADLSSASDSISIALVNRLFPDSWLAILNRSRIGTVRLPNGQVIESLTYCTMGIGYTFPLQTLVFLSLLKAIQAYYHVSLKGCAISVYGDDLIYPSSMHRYVTRHLEEVGFIFNVDKTFSEGHFRESCGGDYYHGVDVRPFQPRNGQAKLGPKAYEAMLYKYTNTLLVRWTEHEIGGTLKFLLSEILRVAGKARRVPSDYPDDSGIKCPTLTHHKFLDESHCASIKRLPHGLIRFSYLRFQPEEREEDRHAPYLWLALRGGVRNLDYHPVECQRRASAKTPRRIDYAVGVSSGASPLILREARPIVTYRSCLTGRRLRRQMTFVTISHSGQYRRQSGISCFEDRRP